MKKSAATIWLISIAGFVCFLYLSSKKFENSSSPKSNQTSPRTLAQKPAHPSRTWQQSPLVEPSSAPQENGWKEEIPKLRSRAQGHTLQVTRQREMMLRRLPPPDKRLGFKLNQKTYSFLPGVVGIPRNKANQTKAEVIAENSLYVFVQSPTEKDLNGLYVVVDEETGELGAVTGRVSITTLEPSTLSDIDDSYSLTLIQEFKHINTSVFFSNRQNENEFVDLMIKLTQDARIRQATLEIIQRPVVPQ